ncbi:hypothetical protein BN946_scf184913.g14 [Trametes cinnabarina]|uniref:Uncharacterized protein n=1 Tax=Pycnoporus cinnabarinus TaxID=5643 RepID=A0A060S7F6_PYCCI|nr:hypothetical protein BN946_scf184913.g14 [Trametes cinnabarina]
MCGGHGPARPQSTAPSSCNPITPDPTESLIAQNLPDGYWLEAFYFNSSDRYPDLIGYGLGAQGKPATITLFVNPKNSPNHGTEWVPVPIQTMDFPVSMSFADLTGDGYNDIIICDRYGPTMNDLWDAKTNDGGRVQWLRNPGNRFAKISWAAKHIGNSTGMHRLKVGHFTITSHFQVLAIPIIPKSGDLTSPAPVIVFTPKYGSDPSEGPHSWHEHIPFATEFRLIHEIKVVPAALNPSNNGLDTALVAGREGVVYLHHDAKKWKYSVVGTGLPQQGDNPYWGSGSVDFGAVGDDPVAYIATCEGFHGNVVSVYIKKSGAPKGAAALLDHKHWTRHKIDDFGPLNAEHTGTIHHVETADVDGTGVQAFAIACMGARECLPYALLRSASLTAPFAPPTAIGIPENEGVYVYRPTDLSQAKFLKSKVTNRSAGRLAIAPFTTDALDIASISYYVPGYHTGPECPSIRISPNAFFAPLASSDIRVHRLVDEVLVLVPRPSDAAATAAGGTSISLIDVAGHRLHVHVLPPNASAKFHHKDGVKVIYGEVSMKARKRGHTVTRGLAPPAHKAASVQILSHDGTITAGASGAVLMRLEHLSEAFQGPYTTMAELPIANAFPASAPPDVRALAFEFVKCEKLAWASNGNWDGFEFYNMTGFHVHFGDDTLDKLCHIQLWTLGMGETARFHIHDTQPFGEIHCCIANGGGTAGMRWFADDVTSVDQKAELTKAYVEDNTEQVVVPALHEHGPLWKVVPGKQAQPKLLPNGCADYPYHAWLASKFGDWKLPIKPPLPPSEQKYDVWLAFEFPILAFQY